MDKYQAKEFLSSPEWEQVRRALATHREDLLSSLLPPAVSWDKVNYRRGQIALIDMLLDSEDFEDRLKVDG